MSLFSITTQEAKALSVLFLILTLAAIGYVVF